ncbi:hypothetical protein [Nitrosovibrio sp. Nv4]|uniref:hypothetical protein n=1 Tax=Nitrosovibrio sp. Nv4 TaxID=1945880 RepID=UPI000BDDB70A|nr:hypothetical protein [Nitrosovibrio sp. Nv4]SOD41613.1 hypothetical protein SAMN06298226_1915 [Nitrosovibrio sp. Nv4]
MAKKKEKVNYNEDVERPAFEKHFINGYFFDKRRFERDPDMPSRYADHEISAMWYGWVNAVFSFARRNKIKLPE